MEKVVDNGKRKQIRFSAIYMLIVIAGILLFQQHTGGASPAGRRKTNRIRRQWGSRAAMASSTAAFS